MMVLKQYRNPVLPFLLVAGLLLVSCKHKESEYHSLNEKIEAESKHYNGISISSEELLEGLATVEVTLDPHNFLIPERKSKMKSFACTECHSKPVADLKNTSEGKRAHWDIELNHADANTMNCATCHDGNDMDNLKSLTGNSIDFNHSYLQCSQCHDKQFEDWKGGAHGKKLEGWAPPRASMTCVNCHNPHDPSFETRWPARFNTQMLKEREE